MVERRSQWSKGVHLARWLVHTPWPLLALDMLRAMRGHVRHLHVLDWTADGKLCLPGRGVFDWQQFARVLREDGFDGAVILEPYAQLVESEQALLESICFLRGVFGAPAQM